MAHQILRLHLDGVLAADYLAYVRDPDPAALGGALRSVTIREQPPFSSVVEALLTWRGAAPDPHAAATLAGLPVTADVIAVDAAALAAVEGPEVQSLAA
jgi:hypothetical protein